MTLRPRCLLGFIAQTALVLGLAACVHADTLFIEPVPLESYEIFSDLPEDQRPPDAQIRIREFRARDGARLFGVLLDHGSVKSTRAVLYVEDRKENLEAYFDHAARLWQLGLTVFLYDQRGFGRSEGPFDEETLVPDAHAALDTLREETGLDDSAILLLGDGFGSVTATRLGAEVSSLGIVLVDPYASMQALVASGMPYVPASYVTTLRLDVEGAIDDAASRTARGISIFHATKADYPEASSRSLPSRVRDASKIERVIVDGDRASIDSSPSYEDAIRRKVLP